jgi:hypothetical protein
MAYLRSYERREVKTLIQAAKPECLLCLAVSLKVALNSNHNI